MRVVACTVVGLLLIMVTLRDVVHELFHPEDTGSMSRAVMTGVWAVVRRIGRRFRGALYHAGPLILICVAFMWSTLLLIGWALIYWPRLPGSFVPNSSLPAEAARGFHAALYVSLASMTTLSASDLTPRGDVVRAAVTLESFVGPVLFTAWITWVLSIYPVLAQRRAFASQIDLLRRANRDPRAAAGDTPSEAVIEVLRSLTQQVLRVTAELRQSRVTYYFQNDTPAATLSRQLPWALAFARHAAERTDVPAVRHHGAMLTAAICGLLDQFAENYLDLKGAGPDEIVRALARDHLLEDVLDDSAR